MDGDEYEHAVRQHKDRVHGHAARMLHELDEARDVAQEALVRLWVHRERIRPETAGSWLLKTVHHLCIDRLRRRRSRGETGDGLPEHLVDAEGAGPERRAASAELGTAIARALASLDPRDRSAILLREVQGMSYEEIAATVGMPLGTLKSVLHRSRERLRRALVAAGVAP